jgi:hypothetical protein
LPVFLQGNHEGKDVFAILRQKALNAGAVVPAWLNTAKAKAEKRALAQDIVPARKTPVSKTRL